MANVSSENLDNKEMEENDSLFLTRLQEYTKIWFLNHTFSSLKCEFSLSVFYQIGDDSCVINGIASKASI